MFLFFLSPEGGTNPCGCVNSEKDTLWLPLPSEGEGRGERGVSDEIPTPYTPFRLPSRGGKPKGSLLDSTTLSPDPSLEGSGNRSMPIGTGKSAPLFPGEKLNPTEFRGKSPHCSRPAGKAARRMSVPAQPVSVCTSVSISIAPVLASLSVLARPTLADGFFT